MTNNIYQNSKIEEYANIMPHELRLIINCAPNDDLDWAIVMYLFRHSEKNNIVTLEKLNRFFDIKKDVILERTNRMSPLWIKQYLNFSEYGILYYTYELNEIVQDTMIKIAELISENVQESAKKDKQD